MFRMSVRVSDWGGRRRLTRAWVFSAMVGVGLWASAALTPAFGTEASMETMTEEEAIKIGKEFGVIVGAVDKDI